MKIKDVITEVTDYDLLRLVSPKGADELQAAKGRQQYRAQQAKQVQRPEKETPAQKPSKNAPAPTPSVPGFTVVSHEPIVVRYKKDDYALNNEGEWVKMGTKGKFVPLVKDTDPTLEKLLDRVSGAEQVSAAMKPAPEPKGEPTIVGQVTIPNGTVVAKWSDGVWTIPATQEQIVISSDIRKLEQLLAQQK